MGTSALPDIYAHTQGPQAQGQVHIWENFGKSPIWAHLTSTIFNHQITSSFVVNDINLNA